MGTSGPMGPPPPPTPHLLPHQLVARDGRSSYLKRVETLAGPGAYVIPSTFKIAEIKPNLREIQRHHYGREFARQQRAVVASVEPLDVDADGKLTREERRDRYLDRRERLRELLQQLEEQQHDPDADDSHCSTASYTTVSPFKSDTLPVSPSVSSASNYDRFVAGYRDQQQQQQQPRSRARSNSRPRSLRAPTSPTSDAESVGFSSHSSPRQRSRGASTLEQAATSWATSPPTMTLRSYRDYLSTTRYSKRLVKHQRPSSTSASPSRRSTNGSPTSSCATPAR